MTVLFAGSIAVAICVQMYMGKNVCIYTVHAFIYVYIAIVIQLIVVVFEHP